MSNDQQQALKVAVQSLHLGVVDDAVELDRVFEATPTADVVAVAEWAEVGAERELVTSRLQKGRVDDLVQLYMDRQDRPVLTGVLKANEQAEAVHATFTALFSGTDSANHKVAAKFLAVHPAAKQALTDDLRRTSKDAEDNRGQVELAAHAKVALAIDTGELNRLFERADTTTENLVTVGPVLTAEGRDEVVVYLRRSERRVPDLFELALPTDGKSVITTNNVVLDAITGHTSPKMDEKLLAELVVEAGGHPRTKAAARLIVHRREAKKAATPTGATAPAADPATPPSPPAPTPDADSEAGASA